MDPRIDELLRITKDTNHMVHKMHRSHLWGRFFFIAWWIAVFALSGYTYYYYAQPYVQKLEQLYLQVQKSGQEVQGFGNQISSFFGNRVPGQATTTPTH